MGINNLVNFSILMAGVCGYFGKIKDDPCGIMVCVAVMLCMIDFTRLNSKMDWKEIFLKENNLYEN